MLKFKLILEEYGSNNAMYSSSSFSADKSESIKRSMDKYVDKWTDFFMNKVTSFVRNIGETTFEREFKRLYIKLAKDEMERRNQYATGKAIKDLENSNFLKISRDFKNSIVSFRVTDVGRFAEYNKTKTLKERLKRKIDFIAFVNWMIKKDLVPDYARDKRALAIYLVKRMRDGDGKRTRFRHSDNRVVYRRWTAFGDPSAFLRVKQNLTFDEVFKKYSEEFGSGLFRMALDYMKKNGLEVIDTKVLKQGTSLRKK